MSAIADWVTMIAARVSPAPTIAVSSDLEAIGSTIASLPVTIDATLGPRTLELRDASTSEAIARYVGVALPA